MFKSIAIFLLTGSLVLNTRPVGPPKRATQPVKVREFTRSDCVISGYFASGNYFESLFAIELLRSSPTMSGNLKKVIDVWWPPLCRGLELERKMFTKTSAVLAGFRSEADLRQRLNKCRKLPYTIESAEAVTIKEAVQIAGRLRRDPVALERDRSLPALLSGPISSSDAVQLCANDSLKVFNIFNLELRAAVKGQPLWDDEEGTQIPVADLSATQTPFPK